MKRILIILITIPLFFGSCEKEEEESNNNNLFITFEKTYGGVGWDNQNGWNLDQGRSGQQTLDGGYVLVGSTMNLNNGINDIYLIKTDQNGNKQWSQTFGEITIYEVGYSVQQTNDGGYIITGNEDLKIFLIKTDVSGNEQWSQTFGNSTLENIGYSVQQTNDGGYIITGTINNPPNINSICLIKVDKNGNEQWIQNFGSGIGNSVQQTLDGGYIITGGISPWVNDSSGICLIKTDGNGNGQWTQNFGSSYSEGKSVQQTSDGGYIITGITENLCLIKTDVNGNEQWIKTFGNVYPEIGNSVKQTLDGGYIITGTKISIDSGNRDVYLIKTDQFGNEQWSQFFGGTGWDEGQSVQQTSDGGYIITGTKDEDICLIKTDPDGNVN